MPAHRGPPGSGYPRRRAFARVDAEVLLADPGDVVGRDAMMRAIDEIAVAVESRRGARGRRAVELVAAIEEMAAATARHASAEAEVIALEVERLAAERRISPVDPSELTWSAFRSFGFGGTGTEIRWTKWLGSLLEPAGCGRLVSRVSWAALSRAIAESAADAASRSFWKSIAEVELTDDAVTTERQVDELGRADLIVDLQEAIVVIENKLDADWHDGKERTQAEAYRLMGERLADRAKRPRFELVLLRNNARVDATGWIPVSYAAFAHELRRGARDALATDASLIRLMEMVPVLATIHAIERELLERPRHEPIAQSGSPIARWHRLRERLALLKGIDT